MGAVGCAWATVVVNYLFLGLAAVAAAHRRRCTGPTRSGGRWSAPHWPTIAQFARLGVPAGLAIMVEVTSFTLMSLFIARQGTLAAAAHQIASNLAAVMYMVPLSIAIATSARVSYWLGAGDPRQARAGHPHRLSHGPGRWRCCWPPPCCWRATASRRCYSADPQVAAVAAGLLAWLAVYHLGDAMQALCVFVLRCYRVAVAPLVAYCVLLWGVGVVGGYQLAYRGLGAWPRAAQPGGLLDRQQLRAGAAGRHPAADSVAGGAALPAGVTRRAARARPAAGS